MILRLAATIPRSGFGPPLDDNDDIAVERALRLWMVIILCDPLWSDGEGEQELDEGDDELECWFEWFDCSEWWLMGEVRLTITLPVGCSTLTWMVLLLLALLLLLLIPLSIVFLMHLMSSSELTTSIRSSLSDSTERRRLPVGEAFRMLSTASGLMIVGAGASSRLMNRSMMLNTWPIRRSRSSSGRCWTSVSWTRAPIWAQRSESLLSIGR